jgi:hypothetical protein
MTKSATPPDNFDRLRKHLKDDSLAAKLAEAHHTAQPADRARSMTVVLQGRLTEIRSSLEFTKTKIAQN